MQRDINALARGFTQATMNRQAAVFEEVARAMRENRQPTVTAEALGEAAGYAGDFLAEFADVNEVAMQFRNGLRRSCQLIRIHR
jgi:hypothetical protein